MRILSAIAFTLLSLCPLAVAQDFLRGDVNGDGKVSLADCYALTDFLFNGARQPDCLDSADVRDDEEVLLRDAELLFSHFSKGAQIPEPFPLPGPDQVPDVASRVECQASGGNPRALADGKAVLKVNGIVSNGIATVTVTLTNTAPVGAYRGTIELDGVIANFDGRHNQNGRPVPDDLLDGLEHRATLDRWSYVRVRPGTMEFGLLRVQLNGIEPIAPGDAVEVLQFDVCLAEGVDAAPDHQINLIEGEVVDAASGLPVETELKVGTLDVRDDVGARCPANDLQDCPPSVGDLRNLVVTMSLPEVAARPGETFTVPLRVRSTADVRSYSFSIGHDRRFLAGPVVFTYQKPDGTDYHSKRGPIIFGSLVTGGAVFSSEDDCNNVPANVARELCLFTFTAPVGVPPGEFPLRFLDNGDQSSNTVEVIYDRILPRDQGSLNFIDGKIIIVSGDHPFRRADTNSDRNVDLSDPVRTLDFLFLGGPPLLCPDASDANDDGTLDLSDAVFTLQWLFLGGREPLSPGVDSCGPDPTADPLGACFYDSVLCQ